MKSNFPTSLFLLFSLSIFLLLTLGTWQLNKNYTVNKNNLYFKNSISLEPIRSLNPNDKIRDLSYVNIQGTELISKTLYLEPRTYKGKIGYHQITVYKIRDNYVAVNKGFTQTKINPNLENKKKKLEGLIINFPDPKFFELNNDKKKDVWHSLNIEDFNKKFNLNLMPYLIYEQNHDYKEEKKAVVPNIISKVNHLNYAFTWYFLGLTMCVIFSLYFKKAFN